MVHQELNLVRQTSVMDNLWLGRYPLKGPFVDHAKMYRDTKAIFDELDIDVDPKEKVARLSVFSNADDRKLRRRSRITLKS